MLQRWVAIWVQMRATPACVRLWTAAVIAPEDCGWQKDEQGQEDHCGRKLRPIALAEVLVKLAETSLIDEHIDRIVRRLEPEQFGCGTPDGATQMVMLVRDTARGAHQDLGPGCTPRPGAHMQATVGLDLENAYGRAYRSGCLRGVLQHAQYVAPLLAAQWSAGSTTYWARGPDGWCKGQTGRGG